MTTYRSSYTKRSITKKFRFTNKQRDQIPSQTTTAKEKQQSDNSESIGIYISCSTHIKILWRFLLKNLADVGDAFLLCPFGVI